MVYKQKQKKRYTKSVPKGFQHIWKYGGGLWRERKLRKGLWKFTYRSSKGKRSRSLGSFGVGTKGAWDIKAKQYIQKTGKGRYNTVMVGTKKPLKFYVKKPRKYK